ncbi:bifunctional helix-turn-helix transcriptional regulator/GNAT family N-acetyltransferase [Rhodopila sp.]|uniref:bifunctional helix-turn-helix transcriptional regulator/GNAT family N-acetyltransferase n=1 Tax=Rhodopila sp. TaxID=2480087 RepID=UPI003D10C9BF
MTESQPIAPAIAQPDTIAAIRRFGRYYTRQLGLLGEGLLKSDFSLTEARVLYELAHRSAPTAADLCRDLALDGGYLSRILKAFDQRGLISRSVSPHDARQALLALTPAGAAAFAPLDRASQQDVRAMIDRLAPAQVTELVGAMRTVEQLISNDASPVAPVTLRPHRLGDLGWIAHRQAILYAQEYGWDETYEALAAEILAAFVRHHDPRAERGWIAERDGVAVGSVFVMRASETMAKLRLLYAEPAVRGTGLGRRLVDAATAFARDNGYRGLTLWTNDVLLPARRIYQAAGFTCVDSQPHHSFGKHLVGETWELPL